MKNKKSHSKYKNNYIEIGVSVVYFLSELMATFYINTGKIHLLLIQEKIKTSCNYFGLVQSKTLNQRLQNNA